MSTKIWRCNNTTCNNTHRIDFNTPSITLDSVYKRFISHLENPQPDNWYTDAPDDEQTPSNVRDNINTLLMFVNQHIGDNSGDYENLKFSITQLHTQHEQLATLLATQLANDGKKRKSKRRKRRSKSKIRSKSKRRKRSKRKI